eukprot:XP_016657220.1 PREDICTED: nuclear hormone receptor family member nhr-10-like [Acyrthosiphon pisum]
MIYTIVFGCRVEFQKRTASREKQYTCITGTCTVSQLTRNNCRYCRWKKIVQVGMYNKNNIQQFPVGPTMCRVRGKIKNYTLFGACLPGL